LIVVTPHDNAQLQLKYGYDSQGRRLWKTAYTYTSGVWAPSYSRHYLWDGNNLVAELDGNNAILMGYTWGPTGLLAETDYTASGGAKTYVVAEDLSQNVEALVDPTNGMPVASFRYEPYGKPTSATGPAKNLDGFEGKEEGSDKEDRNLGFTPRPNGNGDLRVVNYVTNEFMQHDVAGELAGGFNLYQVDGGDPVNNNDPSGNAPDKTVPALKVYWEAVDQVHRDYPVARLLRDDQTVAQTWYGGSITRGEKIDEIYQAKVRWYYKQGISVSKPDPGVTITADNRTKNEIHSSQELFEIKRSGINPQAVLAADIASRHGFVGAMIEAGGTVAPDLLACIANINSPNAGKLAIETETSPVGLAVGGQRTIITPTSPGSPVQFRAGRLYEEERLGERGETKNTDTWRPTQDQVKSAAFGVIVGPPKVTRGGQQIGTIVDVSEGGALEVKGGKSSLYSTYQLRLQVYRSLIEQQSLTIETTRTPNPTLQGWFDRWGVQVLRPKQE
jgi:hypothetical protein